MPYDRVIWIGRHPQARQHQRIANHPFRFGSLPPEFRHAAQLLFRHDQRMPVAGGQRGEFGSFQCGFVEYPLAIRVG